MAAEEAIIQLIDELPPEDVRVGAWDAVSAKRWYFGNQSVGAGEPGFWKLDLENYSAVDRLWAVAKPRCQELSGRELVVLRQYANGHTYGLGGRAHADDPRTGHFTLLYFPMLEWNPGWGGETLFHHQNGEIALAVLPRPGRFVFFDSRILHAGRAPNRNYGGLRVTIAFKLAPPISA